MTIIEIDEIASGCSYGNGGLIVPSHAVPLDSPGALGDGLRWMLEPESLFYIKPRMDAELMRWLARFVWASRTLYEDLAWNVDFDFGFEGKGSLLVYLSNAALEKERDTSL